MKGLPRRVLFVCTGNTCRSVMAEQILRKISKARCLDVDVRSCGLAPASNFPVPEAVYRALSEEGINHFRHAPSPVSKELLSWAAVVLTMTKGHQQALRADYPDCAGKVFVLREYAGLHGTDVSDPMGLSDAAYAACRDNIREAIEEMLRHAMA